MTSVIILILIGFLLSYSVSTSIALTTVESKTMLRSNYRGQLIPVSGGIPVLAVTIIGLCICTVCWSVSAAEIFSEDGIRTIWPCSAVVLICGLFGLIDDSFGTPAAKGLRGHLAALAHGRITSGLLKMFAGGVAGLVGASYLESNLGWIFVGAITIASWSNAGNLFDLGPGRCIKVNGFVLTVFVFSFSSQLAPLAIFIGALAAVLIFDLREMLMLGDSGSNPVGALVGFGALASGNHSVLVGALVVGLALNIAGEFVSFSSVIRKNRVLLFIDLLGVSDQRRSHLRGD